MTVWWSKAILVGAIIAAVALPVGALGSRFGIWDFGTGFLMLTVGVVLATIMLIAGIVALIIASRRGLGGDRPALMLGSVVSALVLALMGMQYYTARSVPPIHNISTDVQDPPAFSAVVALRGDKSNPLDYDADKLAPLQTEAYPWVKSKTLTLAPADAVARSAEVLADMGLDVVAVSPEQGRVEATDTTFWFGFKDDLVVRVQPDGAGSKLDVRSVSRVGQSDLGANARRIGTFLDRLDG